ncbi:hypothetical protein ACFQU9_44445 [Actinomadura namibiensis]|uniref:hypothetical protein n=1 Tax=Actinomadura kijaniata TaxID=46161 RepID=UPI0036113E09
MPRNVQWRGAAWTQLQELPEELRRDALLAVGGLMADPLPSGSETYEAPDTYRLTTAYVTIFYRLIGEEIDVVYVRPNT